MAFPTTWNIEKYKSEFESIEHWLLRKKFMETHKHKFPEERLVCLARVFCNVEFLGCKYPEKTMCLVNELSKGVADEYREKQKGKLKRTFVQASDAAGAKIKGTSEPPSKISKANDDKSTSTTGFKYTCFVHAGLEKSAATLSEGEFPGFLIYESCKTNCPISILTQSAQKNKKWNVINFIFPTEKNVSSTERCCTITINDKVLSSGVGVSVKDAKVKAATEGLNQLRKTCYTIQEKLSFFTDGEVVSKDEVVGKKTATNPLPQDNIGSRMMMKMGWTGTGLGKNQQGIQTPIEASQTMRRAGFGHLSIPQFHDKFRNIFKDYITSGSCNDLVFAPDFSAEERKILHKLAQNMNLKTKSHGKNEQRHLVVYKLMTLPDILEMLLRCGGENEKYLLLHPEGDESSNLSGSSNTMSVNKQNVLVGAVPDDATQDNTTILSQSDLAQPHEISLQHSHDCVAERSVFSKSPFNNVETTNVAMDQGSKSAGVPETFDLISDSETDSTHKLKSCLENKRDTEDYSNGERTNSSNIKEFNIPATYKENKPKNYGSTGLSSTMRDDKYTVSSFKHMDLEKPRHSYCQSDFLGFILFEGSKSKNCPFTILRQSAKMNKNFPILFNYPQQNNIFSKNKSGNGCYCEITLKKGRVLASGFGKTKKEARLKAATVGLYILRRTCYTVKENPLKFVRQSRVLRKTGSITSGPGKNQQGIQTPNESTLKLEGAGISLSTKQFQAKYKQIFKDYIASQNYDDLVFSSEFSLQERAILHRIAQKMKLRTKSHGKNKQRHLVVGKIMKLPEILKMLLHCGGENDNYVLLHPQENNDCDSSLPSSGISSSNPNLLVGTVSDDAVQNNTKNVNRDLKCVGETEPFDLNSESDGNSSIESGNYIENKLAIAGSSKNEIQNPPNLHESEIDVINKVIKLTKTEINQCQTSMDKLVKIYNQQKQFTKTEKRKYRYCRTLLQNVTGMHIINIMNPKIWTLGDLADGRVPKADMPNYEERCKAVGMADVENNVQLKQQVCNIVKAKLKVCKLVDDKKTRRSIKEEFRKIGFKSLNNFEYKGESISKTNPSECIKSGKPKVKPREKKKKVSNKKNPKSFINKKVEFVKETGFEFEDEGSGMEYSDDEDSVSDFEDDIVQ